MRWGLIWKWAAKKYLEFEKGIRSLYSNVLTHKRWNSTKILEKLIKISSRIEDKISDSNQIRQQDNFYYYFYEWNFPLYSNWNNKLNKTFVSFNFIVDFFWFYREFDRHEFLRVWITDGFVGNLDGIGNFVPNSGSFFAKVFPGKS